MSRSFVPACLALVTFFVCLNFSRVATAQAPTGSAAPPTSNSTRQIYTPPPTTNRYAASSAAPAAPAFKPEELEQVVAPIALYPDSLIAQILMASTYPLEVVQAERWTKQNASLKDKALADALDAQTWDPSVKSLVNFPQVLTMMSEKLDWTQKLGDAFIADQKSVLDAVQRLRTKAQASGNLKTNSEQNVTLQQVPATTTQPASQVIVVESANPSVVYVPAYNPTVVYGGWPYPSYPPYSYYPPGYVAGTALVSFGVGVAVGAAWGHAWGNCNWGGGDVDIDVNRNTNINNSIDRSRYNNRSGNRTGNVGGRNTFQHDPSHRKGVAYRDSRTTEQFRGSGASRASAQSRDAYRGRTESMRNTPNQFGGDRTGGSAAGRTNSAASGARNSAGTRSSGFSGVDSGGAGRARPAAAVSRAVRAVQQAAGVAGAAAAEVAVHAEAAGVDEVAGGEGNQPGESVVIVRSFTAIFILLALVVGSGCNSSGLGHRYGSPQAAVDSLVAALRANNTEQLKTVFGPNGDKIISSGDPVADQYQINRFLAVYDVKHQLQTEPNGNTTLLVGDKDWPFPVPIVKVNGGYAFDAAAGEDEILNRRIGRNELTTEQVCLAIADAQRDYAEMRPMGGPLREYAQKIVSDPGKKNGLYWPTAEGEKPSPLGPLAASASQEGYGAAGKTDSGPRPYHGYFYKLLTSQGPNASGGAADYMVDGKLIGGFGVVAYPAIYGNSGIMTFITDQDGVVYERDLGEDTARIAKAMTSFDPGPEWKRSDTDASATTEPSATSEP